MDGNVEKFIFSWLTGRRQCVVINGVAGEMLLAEFRKVLYWAFVIFDFFYINDIDTDLFSKICKFANDTIIGRAVATEDVVLFKKCS